MRKQKNKRKFNIPTAVLVYKKIFSGDNYIIDIAIASRQFGKTTTVLAVHSLCFYVFKLCREFPHLKKIVCTGNTYVLTE